MIRGRIRGRLPILLFLGALACGSEADKGATPPRFLDVACESSPCVPSGSAFRGAGATADSTAIHIGPGRGDVSIPLSALSKVSPRSASSYRGAWTVSVLARGRGSLIVTCDDRACGDGGAIARLPVTSDAAGGWLDVRSGEGQGAVADAAPAPIFPETLTLRLGVDDDSIVDIVDIRVQEANDDPGCE